MISVLNDGVHVVIASEFSIIIKIYKIDSSTYLCTYQFFFYYFICVFYFILNLDTTTDTNYRMFNKSAAVKPNPAAAVLCRSGPTSSMSYESALERVAPSAAPISSVLCQSNEQGSSLPDTGSQELSSSSQLALSQQITDFVAPECAAMFDGSVCPCLICLLCFHLCILYIWGYLLFAYFFLP
jgi:hypothetical protein